MALKTIPYPGFVGPAYRSNVINTSADECINLYKETVETGAGINKSVLMGTPGLQQFTLLPTASNIRGLWAGDNRLFAVSGGSIYEIGSGGAQTLLAATLPTGTTPAQMYSNGTQLWIVVGGQTFIADGTTVTRPTFTTALAGTVDTSGFNVGWATGDFFTPALVGGQITISGTPYTVDGYVSPTLITITTNLGAPVLGRPYSATVYVNAISGTYLNGYFIALAPDSNRIYASNLLDGASTWPDLDYTERIQGQDRAMAVYAFDGNLWVLGQRTTEVYYPSGAEGFPFSPIQGGFISQGIWARYSVLDVDSPRGKLLIWLSANDAGKAVVVAAQGYNDPTRISTYAIEYAISQMATSSDAAAWKYQEGGHSFYVLYFPSASQTWVYDATENEWHQRTFLNGGNPTAQLQWCGAQAFAGGKIYVGAAASGYIYEQSLSFFLDDASAIRRVRTAPSLSDNLNWTLYRYFQIDMQQGVFSVAPIVTLYKSDDGGYTYSAGRNVTGGGSAAYGTRMRWNQLGRSRKRVFKLQTDYQGQVQWANSYLGIEEGNGT